MTTPAERLRSLRWAEELLLWIANDSATSESARQEAHRLSRCFPTQQQLRRGLATPGATLSSNWAEAIFDVGTFLAGLEWSDIVDVEVRQILQTVMRHYPTQHDGWSSASRLQAWPLSELLAEEGA